MRKESDRICKEHGISVIENPSKEKHSRYRELATQAGMPTVFSLVKDAVDEAISKSYSIRDMEDNLKALGFETQFNPKRKYWTVTPSGWKKHVRLAGLGEEYTNETSFLTRKFSNWNICFLQRKYSSIFQREK